MRQIVLDEDAIKQIELLLGEIPMKWASPVLNLLGQNLQNPIGGGGSGPRPPKPEE